MTHRFALLGVALAASCTYNEYTTVNEGPILSDAGQPSAGRGGAGGEGRGGEAGSAIAQGGGGSGGGAPAASPCTGCARVTVQGASAARLELPFDTEQNLRESVVTFRVRVAGNANGVVFNAFARSGNGEGEELVLASVRLDPGTDWQEIGFNLDTVAAFQPPTFIDSGVGGSGFDPGNPFDKTDVEAVGLTVTPDVPSGVFTASTIELDAIRFSDQTQLDVLFSAGGGGVELVDSGTATLDLVAL
jgi:hypothetical protein